MLLIFECAKCGNRLAAQVESKRNTIGKEVMVLELSEQMSQWIETHERENL